MAFLQSSPPREPFLHAPASVIGLIGVLVGAHLAVTFGLVPETVVDAAAFVPARLDGGVTLAGVVPLISHMFLHGGTLHLTMNCLWLLIFGSLFARRFGATLFIAFFLVSGAVGALTHLAFHPGSPEAVIGASGGVSGLMGAGFRLVPWQGLKAYDRVAPLFSRPILAFSAVWLVTNLIFGIIGFDGQTIAWEAHMGGYFFGLLSVGLIDRLWFGPRYSAG